jgi:glycosyltransferase involved in cell wall biosynthesis
MNLDVLIPTRNRARLLGGAIKSLLRARVPDGLNVNIVIVDNGSTDGTQQLLDWMTARHWRRIQVVRERRCGKSRALNAGIDATSGDLVGMVDDDEEVHEGWYEVVFRTFTEHPELEFIGGPYSAIWTTPPPSWIPSDYLAVLGDTHSGTEEQDYDGNFGGILKGGNAVIRRSTLRRLGPYAEYLGPAGPARLLSCEDEDMYLRLLRARARGRYLPSLLVYHHVSAGRLTPAYFRQWCFWRGVSRGLMDRAHPMPVRYLAGVPRFLYGSAARGLFRVAQAAVAAAPEGSAFSDELKAWDLAGYLWGRHIYTLARFSPVKSRRALRPPFPEVVDPHGVISSAETWNSSCYFDADNGSEGARDRDQAGEFCLAERRSTPAPPF